jgi:hypothetical protein
MFDRKALIASIWVLVGLTVSAFVGCGERPAQPVIEQPPVAQNNEEVKPPSEPKASTELPPLTLEEVQAAVKRVFKDAVVMDTDRKPAFLVGDFNGDLSQDLAVILNPAQGKLSELNQEFPNWIAREPLKASLLPKSKILTRSAPSKASPNPAAGQTVRFEQTDVLLAIIHGYGPKGWHDREATQTHVLRDVVGTNPRTLPFKEVVKAYKAVKRFPVIYGDVIEETLIGQEGFVHFAGGTYDWYDPKNFSPKATPMLGHSAMSAMR